MSKAKKNVSFNDIVKNNKPTLVDFHATWCGPCKMMGPILQDLAAEIKEKAAIVKIDVDENRELAQNLNITGVPTLIIYKKGKIVWRQSGVQRVHQLKAALEKHFE